MNKTKITLFAGAAVIAAAGLVLAIRMNTPASTTDGRGAIGMVAPVNPAQNQELNPFSHEASVPATVDPATIRFEKLKTVELASKTKTTTNAQDCKERAFRDPDGSGCQTVTVLERVKAVEASYSFIGPQLNSGEGEMTPSRETFSVYFRPEELPIGGLVEKLKREQAEALFEVSTSRPMVQQKVIDKQNSRFCAGNYVDGSWVQSDPKCRDQVQYINQTVPSTNLAVEVDVRHPGGMAAR